MVIIIKLKKEDFAKILENYYLGEYKSHKHIPWALMNTVYILKTTKGKFILKIFEKANSKFISYQLSIMDFLSNNKIPVPKTCRLKNSKKILVYKKKNIVIQKFIEGKPKEKLNSSLLRNVARNFGLMDRALLKLKIKDLSTWRKDYQFKVSKGNFSVEGFNYKKEETKIINELRELKRDKLRRTIIHGDFHGVNLLVRGGKLKGIIDFDDSHKDYLAYEIAVFMIDPFIGEKKFNKKLAKEFFKEYQKHIKLDIEERKAIYYFTKHRLIGIICWIIGKMRVHTDKKKHLEKMLVKMVLKYHSFSKVPIDEFLSLCD